MRDVCVGDRLDQYQITDLLARGAMGSVFKATDSDSGQAMVLKIPHVQYESDVVFFERFRREEEIGQQTDHPNVVRILTPREKSRMYIAMEFVEGHSLASVLRESGPLPVERALEIARQVCAALVSLHERGIVHRDLKPENIHLTASGQVKILDFGIALLESARRLTWAGLSSVLGTPDYMAPEQIKGRRGDPRTDLYAVGTLLYEMLTGKLPYDRAHPAAILRAKLKEAPTAPSRHVPGLAPALEAIILRAIERDPRDRQDSAAALLEELRHPSATPSRPTAARHRATGRWGLIARRAHAGSSFAAIAAGLASLIWRGHVH